MKTGLYMLPILKVLICTFVRLLTGNDVLPGEWNLRLLSTSDVLQCQLNYLEELHESMKGIYFHLQALLSTAKEAFAEKFSSYVKSFVAGRMLFFISTLFHFYNFTIIKVPKTCC